MKVQFLRLFITLEIFSVKIEQNRFLKYFIVFTYQDERNVYFVHISGNN